MEIFKLFFLGVKLYNDILDLSARQIAFFIFAVIFIGFIECCEVLVYSLLSLFEGSVYGLLVMVPLFGIVCLDFDAVQRNGLLAKQTNFLIELIELNKNLAQLFLVVFLKDSLI